MDSKLQIALYVILALVMVTGVVLGIVAMSYKGSCDEKYSAPYGCFLLGTRQDNGNFKLYARKDNTKGSCSTDFTMVLSEWDESDCGQQLLQGDITSLRDAAGNSACETFQIKTSDSGNVHLIPADDTTFTEGMQLVSC